PGRRHHHGPPHRAGHRALGAARRRDGAALWRAVRRSPGRADRPAGDVSQARPMSSRNPVFWTPILYDVAHAFESVEDPEARVDRVLALMRRFVPYDRCALLEADPALDRRISIEPRAPADDRDALVERLRGMLALLSESPIEDGPPAGAVQASERVHLAVPLIGLGEITGILFVEREAPAYDQSHLAFLSVIAAQ